MLIQKDYKFYAAHRNEQLQDKCRNLHGHRYGVRCFFDVDRSGALSTLFGSFDEQIEPHIKQHYDHSMMINTSDPLYQTLQDHMERTGENLRLNEFSAPTTVENLAFKLFTEITDMGFYLARLEVRETDTSVVYYTREDWVADSRDPSRLTGGEPASEASRA
ncbi:MAG: 6-carboxytetrahydropterin synthase [Planctomycetota bacterium]